MTQISAASTRRGDRSVRIPAPVESMSTCRVLVMDRLEGQALSTLPRDALPHHGSELARDLFESILRSVVVDGVFHADPHPGNVFLLADGQVGLSTGPASNSGHFRFVRLSRVPQMVGHTILPIRRLSSADVEVV